MPRLILLLADASRTMDISHSSGRHCLESTNDAQGQDQFTEERFISTTSFRYKLFRNNRDCSARVKCVEPEMGYDLRDCHPTSQLPCGRHGRPQHPAAPVLHDYLANPLCPDASTRPLLYSLPWLRDAARRTLRIWYSWALEATDLPRVAQWAHETGGCLCCNYIQREVIQERCWIG